MGADADDIDIFPGHFADNSTDFGRPDIQADDNLVLILHL
jgi:hypothetical protein